MWNKRKEEEHTIRSTAPPTSAELAREGIPISTLPGRASETEVSRGTALIGKSLLVKGQLFGREDLTIDGELDGSLELQEHRLTIGPNGKVQANIKAREVVVIGTVHGNIEATEKIDIRKDAKLVGDIRTARIMIEDGAYFKGSIDIQKPEVSRPPAAARPQTAAAAGAAPQQQPLSVNPSSPEVKR
ncbi:MAG: polymer-forming cytoskeletal protein [Bryobacteraceae bacterium]